MNISHEKIYKTLCIPGGRVRPEARRKASAGKGMPRQAKNHQYGNRLFSVKRPTSASRCS